MFPIKWNDAFRKKDGTLGTMEDLGGGGGSNIPEYSSADAGKVLTVNNESQLEWNSSGATVYHGNTLPNVSLGKEGDIYVYTPDSIQADFRLIITKALRGNDEQNYVGAQEIQLFFTDGITTKNIIEFPEFYCWSNGGSVSSAFDGNTSGEYWEKSNLPAVVQFGAKIPRGWHIEKLVVWQRNNAQYLDVWKDFTLAMDKEIILSEANLTQSDWGGPGNGTTFNDFTDRSLDMVAATYYKVKNNGVVQWVS